MAMLVYQGVIPAHLRLVAFYCIMQQFVGAFLRSLMVSCLKNISNEKWNSSTGKNRMV